MMHIKYIGLVVIVIMLMKNICLVHGSSWIVHESVARNISDKSTLLVWLAGRRQHLVAIPVQYFMHWRSPWQALPPLLFSLLW